MTNTNNPYLGERHVWVISTAPGVEYNYVPGDPDTPDTADWGSATAAFGDTESVKLYGKAMAPLLINRILDPTWVEDPDDPDQDPPGIVEEVIPTYTVQVDVDTEQRSQIHPAVEIYDAIPPDGARTPAGLIDGTYYVYPVVFDNAEFCYLPRCSGQYPSGSNIERCISGEGTFPLEPLDTDCTPIPVYPMDAITKWSPSPDPYRDITYTAEWSYYRGSSPTGTLETNTITLVMRVYPPNNDWEAMEAYMRQYTYFYNGIYH